MYHHDNGDIEFIRRDIIGQAAVELDDKGEPKRSWWDSLQCLYPFNGYKNIPGGSVQLAYGRHFHLEIHNILPEDVKPPEENSLVNPFMTQIAEERCQQIAKSAKPKSAWEKLTLILGAALILELIIWGIRYATA